MSTPRATIFWGGKSILKHFMKGTPGWWALHVVAVAATAWLGAVLRFTP